MIEIKGFSALPLESFQVYWIPICTLHRYQMCHDEKNLQKDCSLAFIEKTNCRAIKIMIEEE